ncbi:MAG: LuxR C-terminal-related transcriptional regulator [Ilumatobacteraceae bacterium]
MSVLVPWPRPLTSFVGRWSELALLDGMLADRRLVSIVGIGGCGKTRLVLEGVASAMAHFDRAVFVDVSGCTDGPSLATAVVAALGERPAPTIDVVEVVSASLAAERSLLVLDNCEHLVEVVGDFTERVLEMCDRLVVVCTSREPLGVGGEAVLRVPPLGLPEVDAGEADAMSSDAVTLFVERARLVDATFDHRANGGALARICVRLDGLPLAIELAAARVGVLTVDDIAAGLDDRFRLLAGGPRTAAARHRSMRACIEWSTQLLSDVDRVVLARLAVFPASWTLDAATAVVADEVICPDDVVEAVYRLVDRSLISMLGGDSTRYRLLDAIRDHAAEELQRSGERAAVAGRLLRHVRGVCAVARIELEGSGLADVVRRLRVDHDQLVVAFDHASATGDVAAMWELFGALAFYWTSAGQFAEAHRWFEECVRHPAPGPTAAALGHWVAAYTALYGGRYDVAARLAADAVDLARASGDGSTEARALDVLGSVGLFSGPGEAERLLRAATELAEASADEWCAADAGQILAYLLITQSRLGEADRWLKQTQSTAVRLGNPQLLAWDAAGHALVSMSAGRADHVLRDLERAAAFAEPTADPNITGCVLAWRTMYAAWSGTASTSLETVLTELARCTRLGAQTAVPPLVRSAIEVANSLDAHDEAELVWSTYGQPIRDLAPGHYPAIAIGAAATALAAGDRASAATRLDDARTVALANRDDSLVAAVDTASAALALTAGDTRRAERLAAGATTALRHGDATTAQYDLALVWAAISVASGRTDEAATIARAVIANAPAAWASIVTTSLRTDVETTAGSTPDDHAMTLPDALSYAVRSRTRGTPRNFGWSALTPTERLVVDLASAGLTNAAVGQRLHIGAGTIKTHLAHIYAKLGVANRTELAVEATKRSAADP